MALEAEFNYSDANSVAKLVKACLDLVTSPRGQLGDRLAEVAPIFCRMETALLPQELRPALLSLKVRMGCRAWVPVEDEDVREYVRGLPVSEQAQIVFEISELERKLSKAEPPAPTANFWRKPKPGEGPGSLFLSPRRSALEEAEG